MFNIVMESMVNRVLRPKL